ncbi:MAG TPA: glycerol kinase GlpK [Terracidiphilus sp.]|nr:glycerol kinase GlpK [Terracidiphilus sp.]
MVGRTILALDQGTTNTKAVLVDQAGKIVFRVSVPMCVATFADGRVEQDANDLWDASRQAIEACSAAAGPGTIAAIGISNQRETVVLWDRRSGEPVAPAVVWQCRRSAARCVQLVADGTEPIIQSITGLRVDPLFSASKVEWLLDNTDGLRARAEAGDVCMGTVDSWLIYKLTAGSVHATDASNASRTQLLRLSDGRWDPEMLRLFRIPASMVPSVVASSGLIGTTAAIGEVPEGIPIASAIGDSHAALVGHGVFFPGPVKATYGTGSSLMTLTESARAASNALARTVAWSRNGSLQYALEGNITMAGASVQWVGDFLQSEKPVEAAITLASSVRDSGGVCLVPAMNGLGAPYWDSEARGAIYGLTRTSTAAHLARAAIEAIAHQVADVFEEMQRDQPGMASALYADGGASENSGLMQLQSDLLGRPVLRSTCADLSALGAAGLAGLAIGLWSSFAELASMAPEKDTFEPLLSDGARADLRERWRLAVERTRWHGPGSTLVSERAKGAQ